MSLQNTHLFPTEFFVALSASVESVVVTGTDDDPSKWPQKPFSLTASIKQTWKIAQLSPSALSFRTIEGRVSEEVVIVDMLIKVDRK